MESVLGAFTKVIYRLGIPRECPIAVAVSGGSDSMALTLLATRLFNRVVGLVVDHKLRDDSTEEAARAHSLISSVGAEAHTLTLDWSDVGMPSLGKMQTVAREKRYAALLRQCSEMDLTTLMVAHHKDDQNETFLQRLSMGSGIDGLAGMLPVTIQQPYPEIRIVRPLLDLYKCDLVDVCRSEGVEWVEDPTNKNTNFKRNHFRKVLMDNPHLVSGVEKLMKACSETSTLLNKEVHSQIFSLSRVNTKYGYVTIDLTRLLLLSPPLVKRIIAALTRYVSCLDKVLSYKVLGNIYHHLLSFDGTSRSVGPTVVFQLSNGLLGMTKAYHSNERRKCTPIKMGETLLWENRWEITLLRDVNRIPSRGRPGSKGQTSQTKDDVYYVRTMHSGDWDLAAKGVRAVKATRLPPPIVRVSLPVIVDGDGKVQLVPHFHYVRRGANVRAFVKFKPKVTLTDILSREQ